MQVGKTTVLLAAAVLLHSGLGTATPAQAADSIGDSAAVDFEITLMGLMAFVEDDARVWALLPSGDESVPPPPDGTLMDPSEYPTHYAFLRVRNATVNSIPVSDLLYRIDGLDLRISSGDPGIKAKDMSGLFNETEFESARSGLHSDYKKAIKSNKHVDQFKIDPDFIRAKITKASKRLAARVLIDRGKRFGFSDSKEKMWVYTKSEDPFKVMLGPGKKYADQGRWVVSTDELVLVLSTLDGKNTWELKIKPGSSGSPSLEILNQVAEAFPDSKSESVSYFRDFLWHYDLIADYGHRPKKDWFKFNVFLHDRKAGGSRCPFVGMTP